MSSILANKRVMVYDRGGLFTHVAERFAKYTDQPVLYFSEWRTDFSKSEKRMPGVGLDGIGRCDDFFEHVDGADLIIFPDCGDGTLQEYLRGHGKLVFGTGVGDRIETNKIQFSLWLAQSELPSPDMWMIEGLDSLKAFL